jgi:hypothetical protein
VRRSGPRTSGYLVNLNDTHKIALAVADNDARDCYQIWQSGDRTRTGRWASVRREGRKGVPGEKVLSGEEANVMSEWLAMCHAIEHLVKVHTAVKGSEPKSTESHVAVHDTQVSVDAGFSGNCSICSTLIR